MLINKKKLKIFWKHAKHPLYSLYYAYFLLQDNFKVNPKFLTEKECLKKITTERKSLIRFGDGEVGLLFGDSVQEYQKYTPVLKQTMMTIIKKYNKNANYILAIPKFITYTNEELKKEGRFWAWMPFKIVFRNKFNKQVSYGDAHLFYKRNFINYLGEYIKDKIIIFVSNKHNIETFKKYYFKKSKNLKVIIAPTKNAFDYISKIEDSVNKELKKHTRQDIVIIVSLGPTAKKLVYDYTKKGFQCYDVGKGIDVLVNKIKF